MKLFDFKPSALLFLMARSISDIKLTCTKVYSYGLACTVMRSALFAIDQHIWDDSLEFIFLAVYKSKL